MSSRKLLLAELPDSVSERYPAAEKNPPAKHVVAAGKFVRDAGSTPAASTIFYGLLSIVVDMTGLIGTNPAWQKTVANRNRKRKRGLSKLWRKAAFVSPSTLHQPHPP